jgi:hypothetical protein
MALALLATAASIAPATGLARKRLRTSPVFGGRASGASAYHLPQQSQRSFSMPEAFALGGHAVPQRRHICNHGAAAWNDISCIWCYQRQAAGGVVCGRRAVWSQRAEAVTLKTGEGMMAAPSKRRENVIWESMLSCKMQRDEVSGGLSPCAWRGSCWRIFACCMRNGGATPLPLFFFFCSPQGVHSHSLQDCSSSQRCL